MACRWFVSVQFDPEIPEKREPARGDNSVPYFREVKLHVEASAVLYRQEKMEALEVRDATRILEMALRQKLPSSFHESLVSGVRLCMLFITLFPLRRRPKYRTGRPDYYEANIVSFLDAASGVIPPKGLFAPEDLLLGSNEGILKVARTIQALARASGKSFAPTLFAPPIQSSMSTSAARVSANAPTSFSVSMAISDTVSVGSSGSSTDWCRLDSLSILSSPQQGGGPMSPLSPRDSWVQVSRFEGLSE